MPTDQKTVRELLIIGSGPAGYAAAIYAARAKLKPTVLMGSAAPGGALMTTTQVDNFPGFPQGIDGPVLMEEMRVQAERFGAEMVYGDAVSCDLGGEVKTVIDSLGEKHRARTVILAMGSGYRKLGLPDEDRLSGYGVSWCATCDGYPYQGRDVAVVGGGDSAAEEATFLSRLGARVTLIHRRDRLSASAVMRDRVIADEGISVIWNHEIVELHGAAGLDGLTVRSVDRDDRRQIDVAALFIAIGHEPRSELVAGQVDLDDAGYVRVAQPSTATNLAGVFACGDLVDHHYRQAITAAGSGCAAALDAERHLAAMPSRLDIAAASH